MARSIRWTKNQQQRLSKAVGKFNRKLTMEAKRNPSLKEFLPQRLSVKELKESITTASELKRQEKAIERLFKSGALQPVTTAKGIKTTKYEIDEIKRLTRLANAVRERERKELPDDPEYKGILGSIKDNQLRPKHFDPDTLTELGWKRFVEKIKKQSRDDFLPKKYEQYKRNYLKSLENGWGPLARKSGLYKLVLSLDAATVAKGYYESGYLELKFNYNDFEARVAIAKIRDEWFKYLNNKNIEYVDTIIEMDSGYLDRETSEFFPYADGEENQTLVKINGGFVDPNTGEFFEDQK